MSFLAQKPISGTKVKAVSLMTGHAPWCCLPNRDNMVASDSHLAHGFISGIEVKILAKFKMAKHFFGALGFDKTPIFFVALCTALGSFLVPCRKRFFGMNRQDMVRTLLVKYS